MGTQLRELGDRMETWTLKKRWNIFKNRKINK